MKPVMTKAGLNAMLKALNGDALNFTKIAMGCGSVPVTTDPTEAEHLKKWVISVPVDSVTIESSNDYAQINAVFTNEFMDTEFDWTEVGIYCSVGESQDYDMSVQPVYDVLYAYGHCDYKNDDGVSIKIPKAGNEVFEMKFRYHIYTCGAAQVEQEVIDDAYAEATQTYGKMLEDHLADFNNPHHVDLGDLGITGGSGTTIGGDVSHEYSNHGLELVEDDIMVGVTLKDVLNMVTGMQRRMLANSAGLSRKLNKDDRQKLFLYTSDSSNMDLDTIGQAYYQYGTSNKPQHAATDTAGIVFSMSTSLTTKAQIWIPLSSSDYEGTIWLRTMYLSGTKGVWRDWVCINGGGGSGSGSGGSGSSLSANYDGSDYSMDVLNGDSDISVGIVDLDGEEILDISEIERNSFTLSDAYDSIASLTTHEVKEVKRINALHRKIAAISAGLYDRITRGALFEKFKRLEKDEVADMNNYTKEKFIQFENAFTPQNSPTTVSNSYGTEFSLPGVLVVNNTSSLTAARQLWFPADFSSSYAKSISVLQNRPPVTNMSWQVWSRQYNGDKTWGEWKCLNGVDKEKLDWIKS